MPDLLISALVQAPFVAVMAYLVNQFLKHLDARDEEWRAFMNEADEHLAERLSALTASIERLTDTVIAHDDCQIMVKIVILAVIHIPLSLLTQLQEPVSIGVSVLLSIPRSWWDD